jgi:hypothetical protein
MPYIDWGFVPHSQSTKYFGVSFPVSLTAYDYGWVGVTSTSANGMSISFNKWAYDNTGAPIMTLADTVTTRKMTLSDGRVKLHWTNANEDGIARYEVQTKDASGAWKAVDSDAPGVGKYGATVAKDAQCKIVVEKVDGTTEEVAF